MLGIKKEDLVFYNQGMEKGIRETILKLLTIRFNLSGEQVQTLRESLEKVTDVTALEELSILVLKAESMQEFMHELETKTTT